MRNGLEINSVVGLLVSCLCAFGCTHAPTVAKSPLPKTEGSLEAVKMPGPVLLRLKADPMRPEEVEYVNISNSQSYEDGQLRHTKDERLNFVTQAETAKIEPETPTSPAKFTQTISILKKDGVSDLHDFALPELGEKLTVTADSLGHILHAGDYPPNSIFYVAPISLPDRAVSVGDTWTMQASWLSLEEMVPYQLDMLSILKGFWKCGTDTCAEIELSGEVGFQGPLAQSLKFKSTWKGRIFFAMNAGTVLWSRTDSEERFMTDNVRRDVKSCLEAVLTSPAELKVPGIDRPRCETVAPMETQIAK